jgi:hypothetical protein
MNELFRRVAEGQDRALAARPPTVTLVAPTLRAPTRSRTVRHVALLAGAAAALAFAVLRNGRVRPIEVVEPRTPGAALVARAAEPVPLRFSDGSLVTLRPGAEARLQRLTEDGADVLLERGRLEARIEHRSRTRWAFLAGPFRIRVTGTRFTADWAADARQLTVELHEGGVVVEGPLLGAGLPLAAGNLLRVNETTHGVTVAPITAPAPPAEPPAPATPEPRVARPAARRPIAAAPARVEEPLDAARLLSLGDAARYEGSAARARAAYERVVDRFPDDPLAADALFSLGRLASEAHRPAEAARWFERCLRHAPAGPLAEQASGRLIESHREAGDTAAARRAAAAYLERHPEGTHATLARELLAAGAAP